MNSFGQEVNRLELYTMYISVYCVAQKTLKQILMLLSAFLPEPRVYHSTDGGRKECRSKHVCVDMTLSVVRARNLGTSTVDSFMSHELVECCRWSLVFDAVLLFKARTHCLSRFLVSSSVVEPKAKKWHAASQVCNAERPFRHMSHKASLWPLVIRFVHDGSFKDI